MITYYESFYLLLIIFKKLWRCFDTTIIIAIIAIIIIIIILFLVLFVLLLI